MMKRGERSNPKRQQIILIITFFFSILSFLAVLILAWYVFGKQAGAPVSNNDKQVNENSIANKNFDFDSEEEDIDLDLTAKEVVERVSEHMLLPKGEVTVAVVTNADGLRAENPTLYQHVKNGDKILYYPNGMIIYDAKIDKIIDVLRRYPTIQ